MTDQYGVPNNAFGRVPEPFYALLGRVVMLAAFLEDKLLLMAWALDDQPQDVLVGRHTEHLLKVCRQLLVQQPEELRQAGLSLLDRTHSALKERHALVHSLWPSPTMESARGWRDLPRRQRDPQGSTTVWVDTDEAEIVALITRMGELAGEHDLLRMRIVPQPPR